MDVTCIIQARRQSSRLRDKIFLPLAGRPILQHVVSRCQKIQGVKNIIVAAPTGDFEDPVEELALECGALSYRGEMDDVLGRFYGAAKMTDSKYIMRVTADCPLFDPSVAEQLIDAVKAKDADYGVTAGWPHGLDCEVFTRELLNQAYEQAQLPSEREHVTLWMKGHAEIRQFVLSPEVESLHKGNRWVIDYPQDYDFLQQLYALFPAGTVPADWKQVIKIVDENPNLREINQESALAWSDATQSIYSEAGLSWQPN